MKRMDWTQYQYCQENDGKWHPYVLVNNIDHTGRETGGTHWHGLSMVGMTQRDAKQACREHWAECDGDPNGSGLAY